MDVLVPITLFATHLGFASALGALMHLAQSPEVRLTRVAPIGLACFIVLPFSLALSADPWLRYLTWLAGLTLMLLYAIRPARLPAWLWTEQFAYRYLGGLMLLILVWALGQGISPPHIGLGVLAAFAAGMALQRARNSGLNSTEIQLK